MPESQSPTKKITDTAKMAAIAVILALAAFYLPLVGTIATVFVPLPIAILTKRYGLTSGSMGILVTIILLFLLGNIFAAFTFGFTLGILGLIFGFGLQKSWSTGRLLAFSTGFSIISFSVYLAIISWITKLPWGGIVADTEAMIDASIANVNAMMAGNSAANVAQSLDLMKQALPTVMALMPAFIAITCLLTAIFSYLACVLVFRRLNIKIAVLPYKNWQMPWQAIWLVIIALIGWFVGQQLNQDLLKTISLNLLLFSAVPFTICGFALYIWIWSFTNRSAFFYTIFLIFFILFWVYTMPACAIMGIIDSFANFRKRFFKPPAA